MTAAEIAAERMDLLMQLDNVIRAVEQFRQECKWSFLQRAVLERNRLAKLLELNAKQVPGESN